jgi:hypothetical protein
MAGGPVDLRRAAIHADGSTTRFRSASSIRPKTITASSEAAFRHLPTKDRHASGPFPVILPSFCKPGPNNSERTSRGASAQSFCSDSVVCFCICSGAVSFAVSETFRLPFLKRFTLSVETSDLYWRPFQLWGSKCPPMSSINPARTSFVIHSATFDGFMRRAMAISSAGGRVPPPFDAKHRSIVHAR